MGKQSNIILSIAMLVSNRKDTIRNCMEGLRPLLEAIPSELIVVDTVGEENSDGSLAIAKEYATKVVHFEWCNDFSAARNAGLFEASGEWFMYQDDDEWFNDVTEIIEFFNSGEYKKYNSAAYRTRDYHDMQGSYSMGAAHRMVKLTKETKFVKPVHEYLSPYEPPYKAFSAYTHHYGYVFSTPEKRKAHSQRNLSLLEPEFEKNPWNMHNRMQLVQEYCFMEEFWEKAVALCEETFEQADRSLYKDRGFQWIMAAYVRQANNVNDFEGVIQRAAKLRKSFPMGVLADYAICTMEAGAYYNLKQYKNGKRVVEDALFKRKYIQENPDVFEYQRILDLEAFLEDNKYRDLLKLGVLCNYNLGDLKRAQEFITERFGIMAIPAVSVSVLVSNRKETVRKSLESIKPLLDAVPSELIIVDTVGEENSDGSLSIAKEYATKVVHFDWCDDFAAARNAGLKEAKGEWFLYLDDDEWFENVEELVQFFVSGEYLAYKSASYKIRNYRDKQEKEYNDTVALRMVHLTNKTQFVGCVNETFETVYEPHKVFSSYVHHYGFVYATAEMKQARMQYTLELLQKDLDVYPKNLRNRLQLAIVLSVREPERAVELCEDTLQVCLEKKSAEAYQKVEQILNNLYAKGFRGKEQKKEEKEILLSISMLVSNRIGTIRKCMESLRPLLNAIPSELIVVDTVGEENSDGSLAIAKEYATKVVHFDWCNDFSAARNAGLKEARGQWFMYQDDDEWFEDVTEFIEFFKSGEHKNYKSASYRTKDYFNREGGYSMGAAHRMVKLGPETKFVEPVHEYLSPMDAPCKAFAAYTNHYGYVFDTEEQHKEHSRRNLSLLRPSFEKDPENVRLRAQMVQECMFLEELETEALTLCEETLTLDKANYALPSFQWLLSGYVRLASKNDDWKIVIKRAEEVKKRFPLSDFCRLAIAVMEIKAREKLGQYEGAEELLKEIKKSREFLLENPEHRANQSAFNFEVFLENEMLADAFAGGIVCLHKLEKKKEAAYWTKERGALLTVPQLSISLLVSNNIGTIEKCMESLRPILEQISSELIVVDTVGEEKSDGSLAVAKKYATKMVHFDWCNDFSAARNAGLEQATGEWFMFLDDDEWFEDVSEIVEFFRSGEYLLFSSATYLCKNYTNTEGSVYSIATLGRMTKRGKNTKFVGEIHEAFHELFLPCKAFSAYVHHYGYAYANEQEKRMHIERNISLLEKALNKEPLNLRMRAQMALELATFDNERAMAFCEETFRLCADKCRTNHFQWLLSLVFRLHEALGTEVDEAEKSYNSLKQKFGFNETAENAICYQMTRICIIKELPERACSYTKRYFETLEYLQQNPRERQLQMTADFARYQTEEAVQEMHRFDEYCNYKAGEIQRKNSATHPNWIKSNIKLTIGVLVSNNINTIRNCMESLKPILESVRSELIVVDTVGEENSDGSLAIAKEYATKVVRFEWCNDFAAARNVCIDHAKGEWFLYVDDDEWFDDVQEIVDFFNSGECDRYGQAAYTMYNQLQDGTTSATLMGRFVRRTAQTRFVGRVHEKPNLIYPPCKSLSVTAQHTGYCYVTEEEKKAHQLRNTTLLKQELKEKGYQPNLCAQMVQELLHVEDTWEEGYRFAMECLPILLNQGREADPHAQWIIFGSVRYFSMKDDREGVLRQAAYALENYKLSETALMAICGIAARCAWLLDDYPLTEGYTTLFLEKREWLMNHPEVRMEQNTLDFAGFFEEEPYIILLSIAGMCANRQGKFVQANQYWKQMPWDKIDEKEKIAYHRELSLTLDGLKALQEKEKQQKESEKKEAGQMTKNLNPVYPKLIKSDIKLTIGMLVSNHVQYIRNVMEALQPLLKAVPSELVIIDTKGEETDGSIEICREYTDKIYHFEWCNDFAAARNFCLSHAKGEWFLYQDDDEWFDDVQEFIDFFNSGECDKYFSGFYYTRDYHSDGTYSMGIAGRMIRRTENTRFIGKVHETFNEVFAPNKQFQCFTHHQGYVYNTPEMQKKHQERNLVILWEEFKEHGYDARICSQIMQELLGVKETAKQGFDFGMECMEEFRKKDKLLHSNVQWMLVASVRYFTIFQDYQGTLLQAEKVLAEYPLTQMAQLALAGVVTIEAARQNDADMTSLFAEIYVTQWDWLKNHKEEALLQSQLDFPRYYNEAFYHHMLGFGAIAANQTGDFVLANTYWKRMPWQQKDFDAARYAGELQKTINGLKSLVTEEKKEYNKGDIKLTIGLLVSNRKEHIRKVMEGLKPLLDAVPSELIIVDTKGEESDGSIDVCREYTDKIYPFTWCDDFSAARNVCLEHACGEWFMYQDDDEWFDDVQEFIDFFNSGECDNYGSGYYHTRDYKADGSYALGIAGRMIRLTENTRFTGRVHEGFNEVHGPSKTFRSFTHHYGYVFKDEEERKRHQERNLSLLQKELETLGYTPRICAQIMQEYLSRTETADEGLAFFERGIKELANKNMLMDACAQWMLVASVRYYKIKKDYQRLLVQAKYIVENFELTQVAQMALAGVVIETSAPQGNVSAILTYAPMYKTAWQWLKANEDAALTQKQLDFTKYITQDYAIQIFQAAATCANAAKDYVTAYSYWEMLPWNDKSFDGSSYLKGMQETLQGLEENKTN